ncbi:GH11990 [Drosophila grimshawi]|uniref:GH11990 n=1 Tax=Drosophila grimshawi TaxID=7222 RepID=B4JKU7_DROGR|nr:GH11990 [Drosophila grimshawi]
MANNNNKSKQKLLTQRHVMSRMNFLYQAGNLMAHSKQNTLAAYYCKLGRNVGTKSLMHMSPAVKRTLCKCCAIPLLPGINTTLKLEEKQQQQQQSEKQKHNHNLAATNSSKRRRRHRQRKRCSAEAKADAAAAAPAPAPSGLATSGVLDEHARMQLECVLCGAHRRFVIDAQNECWPERSAAIIQVVTLDRPTQTLMSTNVEND